jgi:hypothetical protein
MNCRCRDAVLIMDAGWIISLSTGASVAITGLLVKVFLPSYLNEKAKNLATKEDVGEITEIIKAIEIKYASDLARLSSKLTTASQINSKQFELELRAYEQIWTSLVNVRAGFLLHRNLGRSNWQASAEENDEKNYEVLLKALHSFNETIENQRPFYSPAIWKSIRELTDEILSEGMTNVGSREFGANLPSREELKKYRYEKAAKSLEINESIDGVCEAIRTRIFELGNP